MVAKRTVFMDKNPPFRFSEHAQVITEDGQTFFEWDGNPMFQVSIGDRRIASDPMNRIDEIQLVDFALFDKALSYGVDSPALHGGQLTPSA